MIKNTSNDLEKLANKDLKPNSSAWVKNELSRAKKSVSYTHLTLPTICSV